jgi:hypothetical protein
MRRLCIGALVVLALNATGAVACGVCIEDRAAVVYDHAVVERAVVRKHQVAFFALDGVERLSEPRGRSVRQLAEAAVGVDRGSARVSLDPVSLSLAFDAQKGSVAQLQRDLARRLAPARLEVRLLQVLDPAAQDRAAVTSARARP